MTWVIEKTTSNLDGSDLRKSPYFVVIANLSCDGLFVESEKNHREIIPRNKYGYKRVNKDVNEKFGPHIVPESVDLTQHFNNF